MSPWGEHIARSLEKLSKEQSVVVVDEREHVISKIKNEKERQESRGKVELLEVYDTIVERN